METRKLLETQLRHTPTLMAQEACKEAVIKAAIILIEEYYEPAKKEGKIHSYKTLLETYNNGYEFEIYPFYTFESNPNGVCIGFGNTSIKLYPYGYFDSDFKYQQARIEGRITFGKERKHINFEQDGDKIPVKMGSIIHAIKELDISLAYTEPEEDNI